MQFVLLMFTSKFDVKYTVVGKCTTPLVDLVIGYVFWLEASYLARHLTLYSPKPQQYVRQWRPFANKNEANAQKS